MSQDDLTRFRLRHPDWEAVTDRLHACWARWREVGVFRAESSRTFSVLDDIYHAVTNTPGCGEEEEQ